MSVLWAAFLGLVQGVSEFLPISSSGHLSIIQNLFGGETTEGHMFFDVLLHLGTLVAVCVAYRSDIIDIVKQLLAFFELGKSGKRLAAEHRAEGKQKYPAVRLVLMIIIATLPLFVVLPVNDLVEQLYYKTWFIGIILILTGVMLYASDRMPVGNKTEKNMTFKDTLIIGVCQAVATIPGLSRSGTTITAGIVTGLDREFAVKFSFLLSLPAVLGANILSLVKAIGEGIDVSLLPAYLVGMAVAMVSGYFSIALLRRIVKKGKFGNFAYYCWGVGVITIILSIIF